MYKPTAAQLEKRTTTSTQEFQQSETTLIQVVESEGVEGATTNGKTLITLLIIELTY